MKKNLFKVTFCLMLSCCFGKNVVMNPEKDQANDQVPIYKDMMPKNSDPPLLPPSDQNQLEVLKKLLGPNLNPVCVIAAGLKYIECINNMEQTSKTPQESQKISCIKKGVKDYKECNTKSDTNLKSSSYKNNHETYINSEDTCVEITGNAMTYCLFETENVKPRDLYGYMPYYIFLNRAIGNTDLEEAQTIWNLFGLNKKSDEPVPWECLIYAINQYIKCCAASEPHYADHYFSSEYLAEIKQIHKEEDKKEEKNKKYTFNDISEFSSESWDASVDCYGDENDKDSWY